MYIYIYIYIYIYMYMHYTQSTYMYGHMEKHAKTVEY